jgi:hypothetical protein
MIRSVDGLCCTNLFVSRGIFPPCKSAWCDGCYTMGTEVHFRIRKPDNELGMKIPMGEEKRFTYGRAGDQFVTRFQCDICHFVNIRERLPNIKILSDSKLLSFIRRATLDAMWSRESGTVEKNLYLVKRSLTSFAKFEISPDKALPKMGPCPIKDDVGMSLAVAMLDRSLDAGRTEETLQFESLRKMKAAFGSLWNASIEATDQSVSVRGQLKTIITKSPTNQDWFERFMTGMHKRMGDVQRPDRALSIEAILLLDDMLKKEIEFARRSRNMPGLEEAILLGFYVTIGFCGGLRGEEIVMAHYKGIKEKYEESINNASYPFVMLTLLGRFKGKTGDRFHWQPLALCTSSGIDIKY